jgi:centrosomal protein CEP104
LLTLLPAAGGLQGDYGAAQPLYERALRVYEASYGSNHQEVAHTLTDLAVLHLEQVRG